jgi:transposase-like protein
MTSTNPKTPTTKTPPRKRQPGPSYPATEKAQAVLAVWTEKCKPAEVCRQLKINWITFQQWQQRAMEGMLQALESRINLSKGEALSPRLQELLHKQHRTLSAQKVSARLEQLQNSLASPSPQPHKSS